MLRSRIAAKVSGFILCVTVIQMEGYPTEAKKDQICKMVKTNANDEVGTDMPYITGLYEIKIK